MPFTEIYSKQVSLLLRTIPHIAKEDCFALKGGTAINLFVRDLPRLSVDIDLTYVPIQTREISLHSIHASMGRIKDSLQQNMPNAQITESVKENTIIKLIVRENNVQIKIEVTPVLRGCVYEPEIRTVSPMVEDQFGFAEMQLVSFADLYAGKLMAALDRQHPRDLFDVRELLANEGIDDDLRRAFVVYLLSHDRPMFEVLRPTRKDITHEYAHGFEGMTEQSVSLSDLIATREEMIEKIVHDMPQEHKDFLISFEKGQPEWDLLGVDDAKDLPAVKWRQLNLDKISEEKRADLVESLEEVLLNGHGRSRS